MNPIMIALGIGLFLAVFSFRLDNSAKDTTTKQGGVFTPTKARDTIRFHKLAYGRLADIPEDVVLAIIQIESGFNPIAQGSVNEYGLMQLIPSTWEWVIDIFNLPSSLDWKKPEDNILVGMHYLARVKQDLNNTTAWEDVAQAYNVGPAGFLQGRRASNYLSLFKTARSSFA